MTIEPLTPERVLADLSITDEEVMADLSWPYSAEAEQAKPEHEPGPERTLTVSWDDPLEHLPLRRHLSGREYLERMRRGEIPPPPIARLMGFDVVEIGYGRATFECTPGEQHYNPIGVVHGGLAATLLDSVMGCAVDTLLPAGAGYTTLELKINFTRPITLDTGRVLAEGTVIHSGARVATAEGRIFSARTGKLLAHGTSTLLLIGQ
jgi:uncharacterized protein (TIGR00369 family)